MQVIKDWVYDPKSEKKMTLEIGSLGLRKYLEKKFNAEYRNTGVYYKWDRKSPQVTVEKTKKFKQTDFLKGFAKASVPSD